MGVKKDKAIIFHEEGQTCEIVNVEEVSNESIATPRGMYPLVNCTKHLDIRNGNLLYMVSAALPARVEAEKLMTLRRSVALKRMFEFQIKKKMDISAMAPWIIVVLLILFK
ncbi:hypothetical protein [Paenibacillus sp. FSL R7-0128]|uniref:hypothetical protein n=1 Tax=Paenibacillus sp. FSL R7-0128 TaxID=2954529 RepID=UPI0030F68269